MKEDIQDLHGYLDPEASAVLIDWLTLNNPTCTTEHHNAEHLRLAVYRSLLVAKQMTQGPPCFFLFGWLGSPC